MKRIYFVFMAAVLLVAVTFGLYSLIDKDDEVSVRENRGLKQFPEFSWSAFADGSYMVELEDYYAEQFPLREKLLALNSQLNRFYNSAGGSSDGAVLLETTGNAGAGGIGGVQQGEDTQQEETPQEDGTSTGGETPQEEDTPSEGTVDRPQEETPDEAPDTEEEDPAFDNPEDAVTVNSMLVVGDRALEIVYGDEDLEAKYAAAVNSLAQALGSDVQTYSIVVPNATQFYGPEDLRSGSTDQQALIDNVYNNLDSGIISVDAYSALRSHIDEYIYFRTDHHWTQLGAYYAYTAFCEAAGLEAVPLDEFETGQVTNSNDGSTSFLGTLYKNVYEGAPATAAAMEANPDTVTYYKPVVETNATAYKSLENGELYGAWNGVTTVASSVGDSYLYMAFLGGDQPIEIIETDVDNDRVCIVLKESYGNAFAPFLTSHYSKVVVVDPREFNNSEDPSLYLPDLAQLVGATDLIVINYPFIPVNEYYITRLNRLAGQ